MGEMFGLLTPPPPQSNGILPGTICTIRKHLVIHNIIYEHVLIDRQKYEAGD